MKNSKTLFIGFMAIAGLILLVTNRCSKDDSSTSSSGPVPVLTTTALSNITDISASCGGNITDDKGSVVTQRGVCWSTSQTPTIANSKTIDGDGAGSFVSSITGLTAKTKYYVRSYATNKNGTGYGSILSFTTPEVIDIDGNTYTSVTIGTQKWMAQSLKVTHYNNGDPIDNITNDTQWGNLSTGAYCDYNNTPGYSATYGRIYNGYAVQDNRKICPSGWHVSTYAEWTSLQSNLGGSDIAGGKLKESGTTHWNTPNTGATNETGFTALPGGLREIGPVKYSNLGILAMFWTPEGYNQYMTNNSAFVDLISYNLKYGINVRCVKDQPK